MGDKWVYRISQEDCMDEYIPFLRSVALFRGLKDDEILSLLRCLNARTHHFEKSEIIWEPMLKLPYLGVIIEGGMMILQEDWRGNRSIMGDFGPGDFLSEGAMGAMDGCLPFYLCVREKTTCLLLDQNKVMAPCGTRCEKHLFLLRNLAEALMQKEMRLLYRIEYLSKRSTREKIISYLTLQSARAGSRKITVPYTRQELADILAVDRSAMCTELTRMQNDGLIRYDRRCFELLDE